MPLHCAIESYAPLLVLAIAALAPPEAVRTAVL